MTGTMGPVYTHAFLFDAVVHFYEKYLGGTYYVENVFGQLQRIGKALMLPVAILPAAGLLLGIGAALQTDSLVDFFLFSK